MKQSISRIIFFLLSFVVGTTATASEKPALTNDAGKNGYSLGYDIGRSLKMQVPDVDAASMAHGLKDALQGTTPALPEPEIQQRAQAVKQESARRIPERNRKDGEAFLAKNKSAKGVQTTASGLQYKVLHMGKGNKPKAEDSVTVNYRGTLIDGTEFDSSYKRNQPASFPLRGVIPGWTEALQLMPVGSKWMLYLPAALAYGERGAGQLIGPNSALIFEVELLSIGSSGK